MLISFAEICNSFTIYYKNKETSGKKKRRNVRKAYKNKTAGLFNSIFKRKPPGWIIIGISIVSSVRLSILCAAQVDNLGFGLLLGPRAGSSHFSGCLSGAARCRRAAAAALGHNGHRRLAGWRAAGSSGQGCLVARGYLSHLGRVADACQAEMNWTTAASEPATCCSSVRGGKGRMPASLLIRRKTYLYVTPETFPHSAVECSILIGQRVWIFFFRIKKVQFLTW